MDMPEWMEKAHMASVLHRTIGENDKLGAEEMVVLPRKEHVY